MSLKNRLVQASCTCIIICLACAGLFNAEAEPELEIVRTGVTSAILTWPGNENGFTAEFTDQIGVNWQSLTVSPVLDNGRWTIPIEAGSEARFYRLTAASSVTGIQQSSPFAGESGVAVTRETIFRFTGPLGPDAVFTRSNLFAEFEGRSLLSRVELSSDRRSATLFYLENLPASARVRVTLNGAGLLDPVGQPLDADDDGKAGGSSVLEFDTAGITPLAGTAVIGRVFASEKVGGTNQPLENVTITVDGAEESLRTVTDATGSFMLSPAPAGRFFVHIDGRTAIGSQWPGGAYYPFVGKAWEAVAGKTNNLAGGTAEIYLPLIQGDALKTLSATEETKITFSPSVLAANPGLAGVEITVPANALFSDSGARGGKVGMAPVSPDRLPEPLPPGLSAPLVITIQTDGGANFDRPVPVRFPNLPDPITGVQLAPGEKTVLWSFNHDTGRWEPQGTMTISPDGQFAVSDPGVGVRQPGWHAVAGGSSGGGPAGCLGPDCDGPKCGAYPARCCEDWEHFKAPCKPKQIGALWAIKDFAVDGTIAALGGPGGCKLGAGLGTFRAARDCGMAGGNGCSQIAAEGAEVTAAGCAPVVGGVFSVGADGFYIIKGYFDYRDCLESLIASCAGALRAQGAAANQHEPRLQRAFDALELQQEVAIASSNALTKILGGSVWASVTSPESLATYRSFMAALTAALAAESAGGGIVTAAERTALLGLPRPNEASEVEVNALISRIEGFGLDSLKNSAALRMEVTEGFDLLVKTVEKLEAKGWTSWFDGLLQALVEFSSMSQPEIASFPKRPLYYHLHDYDTGFLRRGRLSATGRFEGIVLRPNTYYSIVYFDPQTGMTAASFFRSQSAGNGTKIPTAPFITGTFDDPGGVDGDQDGDGLADHAEAVVGTSTTNPDSDGDGVNDGQEIAGGTDPLDGTPATIGVVASADTSGIALGVYARGNHAFVADGSGGLTIFELNDFKAPILVAKLAVSGEPHAIAGAEGIVALGTTIGMALADVMKPNEPKLLANLDWGIQANSVAVRGGQAAAALANGDLVFVDATTGLEQQRLPKLDSVLQDLQFSGSRLFVLSGDELIALEHTDGLWTAVGRVSIAGSTAPFEVGRKLLASGDLAWVGYSLGFASVNLQEPSAMKILGAPTRPQLAVHDLAMAGSGTLATISGSGGTASLAVSLYDVRQPETVTNFIASINTGGDERALTIHRGMMLVAASGAGLQIVNFLPPDLGTNPPSVSVTPEYPGLLPRADFGAFIPVSINAADDVGIRSIELEVDGQIVEEEGSVPLRTSVLTPSKSSGKMNVTLRARATDLAGLKSWSTPVVVSLVEDATPPRLASVEPAPGASIVPGVFGEIRVTLSEALTSPVTAETLGVARDGPDQKFGTADDVAVEGTVTYDPVNRTVIFTASAPLGAGRYQATLASGLSDAAGNARARAFSWQFTTGPQPHLTAFFPPKNFARVGGILDQLAFTFDQPVPKISANTYVWKVLRRGAGNTLTELPSISISQSPDSRIFLLSTTPSFPPGQYRVTGAGPNVGSVLWDFTFRDVPNESTGIGVGAGTGPFTIWKYPGGPAVNDELIVNLPGEVAPIETLNIKSITASSDIRFFRQGVNVPEPIVALAGLEIVNTQFGPGTTTVRGPLAIYALVSLEFADIGQHTINAFGGGYIGAEVLFSDPNGALINHPGSTLVLSNGASFQNSSVTASNAGRIVNLGTLRTLADSVRLEKVRLRNEGRLEILTGELTAFSIENEGMIDVTPGAKLVLAQRTRSSSSSSISADGAVEFGIHVANASSSIFAEADIQGDFPGNGPITVVAGTATLWRPLVRTAAKVEVQNGSLLKLLAPAKLGLVKLASGRISFNSDSEMATLSTDPAASVEVETVTRLRGDSQLPGLTVLGRGTLVFEGLTVISNSTQPALVGIGDSTVRNTGTWQHSAIGTAESGFASRRVNGQPGRGFFENAGTFEQTTDRTLTFKVPFRNAGRAILSRGPVAFDARVAVGTANFGAFLPRPGSELVLNSTDFQHHNAGTLDLAHGILRGTGVIGAVNGGTRPKVINRAVLHPGNPVGDLSIRATDGFEQTETGELGITLSSNGNSRLVLISTPATLAGALRVELEDGFSPTQGQIFTILDSTGRTGEFTKTALPEVGPGRKLQVNYDSTSVKLEVVTAP